MNKINELMAKIRNSNNFWIIKVLFVVDFVWMVVWILLTPFWVAQYYWRVYITKEIDECERSKLNEYYSE